MNCNCIIEEHQRGHMRVMYRRFPLAAFSELVVLYLVDESQQNDIATFRS